MAKWEELTAECARLRAEAANSDAQRDEAVLRAEMAEEARRAVEADLADKTVAAHRWMNDCLDAITSELQLRRRAERAEAELARRDAAERNHTTARLQAAQDMRKGRG